MCEAASTKFHELPKPATIGDRDAIVSPKTMPGVSGYEESFMGDSYIEFSMPDEQMTETNLIKVNYRYIDMLRPPEIPGWLIEKLHIDPTLEERLAGERHIKYVLNNLYNIIGESLHEIGFSYRINANLRDKGNVHGWERMEIIIKFPDEHYDEIDGYRKCISSIIGDFYKSLRTNAEFSEDIVNSIRKFVYIMIRSEE